MPEPTASTLRAASTHFGVEGRGQVLVRSFLLKSRTASPRLDDRSIVLDAPDGNREALVQFLAAEKRVNPSADGNWHIQPVPGVKQRFYVGCGCDRAPGALPADQTHEGQRGWVGGVRVGAVGYGADDRQGERRNLVPRAPVGDGLVPGSLGMLVSRRTTSGARLPVVATAVVSGGRRVVLRRHCRPLQVQVGNDRLVSLSR